MRRWWVIIAILLFSNPLLAQIVRKIDIQGLGRVSESAIRRLIHQKVGLPLNRQTISNDVKRIYETGLFDDCEVKQEPLQDGVRLIYQVKERPWIKEVVFKGNDEVKTEDLKKLILVSANEILNLDKVRISIEKIRKKYEEEGLLFTNVGYELQRLGNNTVKLIFIIKEREKVRVHSVRFIGNKAISDEELREHIQTRKGTIFSFLTSFGILNTTQLQMDRVLLGEYYRTKGFLKVKVSEPVVELYKGQDAVDITFTIDEGPQYWIGGVNISGDFTCPDLKGKACRDYLLSRLATRKGELFSSLKLHNDMEFLTRFLQDQGYAFANVSLSNTREDSRNRLVYIDFNIDRGSKAVFGKIVIKGNDSTRDWTIRRELLIFPGEPFSKTLLEQSVAMVRRLGFFEDVKYIYKPDPKDPKLVDVTITVKERRTGAFMISAGLSTFESFLFQAQIGKKNFLGRGQSLQFVALLSSIRSQFTLDFYDPHFLDTDFTFGLYLIDSQRQYYDFNLDQAGGSLTIGHWLTHDLGINGNFQGMWSRTGPGGMVSSVMVRPKLLYESGLTTSIGAGLWYDTRNDRMLPSNGWYFTANIDWATRYLGGDYSYIKMVTSIRRYFPLFWTLVMKLQGNFGWIITPPGGKIPIMERFFCGGIYSNRGFQFYSLSPTIPIPYSYDPSASIYQYRIGGNKKVELTAEIELPIVREMGLRGVVFFDTGNAFGENEWVNPINFRSSVGFGIRWFSPMGPLRFEWGFPIHRKKGEDAVVFQFTMGGF